MASLLSEVAIANDALLRLGEQQVTALNEDSRNGRLVNHFYASVRDSVLASHPWNEAIKRSGLARLTTTPAWGFSYLYQLPSDFITLIRIDGADSDFRIEQRTIATDLTTMNIVYVFRLTDVAAMSEDLKKCISTRMSAEMSKPITGSDSTFDRMWTLHQQALNEARYQDSRQGPIDRVTGSTWVNARLGYKDRYRGISDPT